MCHRVPRLRVYECFISHSEYQSVSFWWRAARCVPRAINSGLWTNLSKTLPDSNFPLLTREAAVLWAVRFPSYSSSSISSRRAAAAAAAQWGKEGDDGVEMHLLPQGACVLQSEVRDTATVPTTSLNVTLSSVFTWITNLFTHTRHCEQVKLWVSVDAIC